MDHLEALNIALNNEKESMEVYRQFFIKHVAMRELFEFLMDEEQKHFILIKKKISELYKYRRKVYWMICRWGVDFLRIEYRMNRKSCFFISQYLN